MKREQEIGFDFEREFAKRIGGKLTPGSGNQWFAKLDVRGHAFLWSLKATKHASFRLTTGMLKETIDAVEGPGGVGGDTTPGMGIRMSGEDFVVLRMRDFIGLVKEDVKLIPPTRREEREVRSSVPKLLRKAHEDG